MTYRKENCYFIGILDSGNKLLKINFLEIDKRVSIESIGREPIITIIEKLDSLLCLVILEYRLENKKLLFNDITTIGSQSIEELKSFFLEHNEQTINNILFSSISTRLPPSSIYIDKLNWELLLSAVENKVYPLLLGPKGSGKSTISKEIANVLGYDFYKINCAQLLKPKQSLIGMTNADNGKTFLTESLFLKHFKSNKPTLIFLDELSRTPSIASNYLITVLDEFDSYLYIEDTGETIYKGENVTFIGAANFGFEYTDTRSQDGAFIDRFVRFQVDYLTSIQETKLVKQRYDKIEEKELKLLITCANVCRKNANKLQNTVSTRQVLALSSFLAKGFKFSDIFKNIFLNLFKNGDIDDSATVIELLKGII